MEFQFEWDPNKDRSNHRKHGVSFAQAATIFLDSNQLSVFDDAHSDDEDRWATMGMTSVGMLCVVIHTFQGVSEELCKIRIISARQAHEDEAVQYREQMA